MLDTQIIVDITIAIQLKLIAKIKEIVCYEPI